MESTGKSGALKGNEQVCLKNQLLTYLENSPPFASDASQQSMEALSKVLKEAAKNWLWRHHAAQLDAQNRTELGTLAYLPVEIRRQIWDHLLRYQLGQHRCTPHADTGLKIRRQLFISDSGWSQDSQIWESPDHDVIEIRQDNYFSRSWPFKIRRVSPTIRDECDRIVFSSRILRFECPDTMGKFFSRISTYQRTHLFRIRINVFADCNCGSPHRGEHPNGWLAAFTSLPPNLRTMVIETGKNEEFIVVAREGRRPTFGATAPVKAAQSMGLKKRLVLLDMLINRARRCVPGLVVSMGTWHWEHLYPGKRTRFESLFL